MNKIYTDLSQSKKLLELGIDITTADMYYSFDYNIEEYEEDAQIIPQSELEQHFSLFPEDVPAWSLAALLSIIPKSLIYTPSPFLKGYCCKNIENDIETYGDDSVDAAFEMICWLLENKKI